MKKVLVIAVLLAGCSSHQPKPCATDTAASLPGPVWIPERHDYTCPVGYTVRGGWKPNGTPLDPYRGVTCKKP